MERSRGTLRVSVKLRDGETVLDRFRQEGCLKARLPRPERSAWTQVVTLNSAGGIAQGDRLDTEITAGDGTSLTVASQAAERYYRCDAGGPAVVRTALTLGAGASMEWLPQETILFEGCRVDRRLDVDLTPDAWFLGVETLVFGRLAMGETLARVHLQDRIRLRRGGRLMWQDVVRLDGAGQALLDRAAVAGGGRAVATLLLAGPGAGDCVDGLRAALTPFHAGVSAFDGIVVARIVSVDGACARAAIVAALAALRAGRPLPRVWSC